MALELLVAPKLLEMRETLVTTFKDVKSSKGRGTTQPGLLRATAELRESSLDY